MSLRYNFMQDQIVSLNIFFVINYFIHGLRECYLLYEKVWQLPIMLCCSAPIFTYYAQQFLYCNSAQNYACFIVFLLPCMRM